MSVKAVTLINAFNLVAELTLAASTIASRIAERQNQRDAEGRSITDQDVEELMSQGDVQAALERAELAKARLAQTG
jgi:hypothetical protein